MIRLALTTGAGLLLAARLTFAFDGHRVVEGPLTLFIAPVPLVTNYDQLQPVNVTLTNTGAAALSVALEMTGLVDECRAVGAFQKRVELPAQGSGAAAFQLAVVRGAYSALYPLHISARFEAGGQARITRAIRIFTNDFSGLEKPSPLPLSHLMGEGIRPSVSAPPSAAPPARGAFPLATRKDHRVTWQWFDKPLESLPVGWTGSEPKSSASLTLGPVARGETRQALQMHPPWRGGAGTVFVEYRLKLPDAAPLRLAFFNAIRDHSEKEPPSDGVTFRVWANSEKLFERHTDSKVWLAGEADLARFRGQEVLLRLESHPGRARDTTCDSSFWGDPAIIAGPSPVRLSEADKERQRQRANALISTGRAEGKGAFLFNLDGGCRAAVVLGPNGLADGTLAFGAGGKTVALESFQMNVLDLPVGGWPAGIVVESVSVENKVSGSATDPRILVTHRLQTQEGRADLLAELSAEGAGLRVRLSCPQRITDLAPGPSDRLAPRVYFGHGYGVEVTEPFRVSGGGHSLSTSHVGFEYDNGLALLVASDVPVDYLQVDPAKKLYTLHTHPNAAFTFVPSLKGAFDAAFKYRPLYDKKTAPAVARKAGRFVFDLWGGRYADDTAKLQRCFDYGMTNSLVLMHVWQRWGYDYRLPDIFPPLPSLGSLEDLRELGQACRARGVLWGLHDNYIDIYPDATDFSYENVTFDANGRPRRAWLNEGRDAQSYQFRPDRVMPFLRRNLDLIQPALQPTASFVDVWTSINAFDYYDRRGQFHSKLETLRCWGEGFAALRTTFGGHAPTTSEAGSDQLIGWLDGADCQFLQLGPVSKEFHIRLPCRDWERVPWFDAVNHTRFSLHGVGYSGRYEGGRGRTLHGIDSDDYLSAEILTGHALMTDLQSLTREAVRKYWLAQKFIEGLAFDELAGVEYAGGDLHRLILSWQSGARAYVNRGPTDWPVAGRVLPQYGYWAKNGAIESAVERLGNVVVEQSREQGCFYVNGRGFLPRAPLAIQPQSAALEYLGGRQFRLKVTWQADQPAPRDLTVFYHFARPTPGRRKLTEFYGGGTPVPATSQWKGRIETGADWTVTVPDDMPLGDYEVLVGLYNPKGEGGRRYRLLGDEDTGLRYRLGRLTLAGAQNQITAIRHTPPEKPFIPSPRLLPNPHPTDFGAAHSLGGFRAVVEGKKLLLMPLPDGEDFPLTLRLDKIFGREARARALNVVDARGAVLRPAPYKVAGRDLQWTVAKDDFGYELRVE